MGNCSLSNLARDNFQSKTISKLLAAILEKGLLCSLVPVTSFCYGLFITDYRLLL